jgi:Fur family ferric uptake transcriptional regulator/Fur family peroxide stress response transcriptional regulator
MVLMHLISHRNHETAEEVYNGLQKEMPMLSKTTVYNTLKLFQETGVVQAISIGTDPVCFDADTSPHAHFYCKMCKRLIDIPIMDTDWDRLIAYMPQGEGEMQIFFKGICRKCKM